MKKISVLIVEDDKGHLDELHKEGTKMEYLIQEAISVHGAKKKIDEAIKEKAVFDFAIIDLKIPKNDLDPDPLWYAGLDVIKYLNEKSPSTIVFPITAFYSESFNKTFSERTNKENQRYTSLIDKSENWFRTVWQNINNFVNDHGLPARVAPEAIMVVDLCESRRIGKTYGNGYIWTIFHHLHKDILEVLTKYKYEYYRDIGDGYMVTFEGGNVDNAVSAAIEIINKVKSWSREREEHHWLLEKVFLSIGLNYGEVGILNDSNRKSIGVSETFTVEGLELSDRKGKLKNPFPKRKNRIMATDTIFRKINKRRFKITEIGLFKMKGGGDPATIYNIDF